MLLGHHGLLLTRYTYSRRQNVAISSYYESHQHEAPHKNSKSNAHAYKLYVGVCMITTQLHNNIQQNRLHTSPHKT